MFLKCYVVAQIYRVSIDCVSSLGWLFAPLEKAAAKQNWRRELDQVLRGEKTRVSNLQEGSIWINTAGLSVLVIALGMVYDACMGTFALLREGDRFIINCSRRW